MPKNRVEQWHRRTTRHPEERNDTPGHQSTDDLISRRNRWPLHGSHWIGVNQASRVRVNADKHAVACRTVLDSQTRSVPRLRGVVRALVETQAPSRAS